MKKISILIIALFVSFIAIADTSPQIQKAIQLEKTKGAIYGLKVYKRLIEENPRNMEALQRGALASARLVQLQKTKTMEKSFAALTYKYAYMAYKLNKNNAQNNYLMALSNGLIGLNASLTDKVKYAQDIEKFAKRTIQLDAKHPYVYHLLGKLYYEMSQISSIEKKIASKVFGELPEGNLQKSLRYMQKCYQINPSFIVNLTDMGLTLHKLHDDKSAKVYLTKAVNTKPYYVEDRNIIREAQDLLRVIQ